MKSSMILEQYCFALIKSRTCPKSFKKQKMNENGNHKRKVYDKCSHYYVTFLSYLKTSSLIFSSIIEIIWTEQIPLAATAKCHLDLQVTQTFDQHTAKPYKSYIGILNTFSKGLTSRKIPLDISAKYLFDSIYFRFQRRDQL